MAKGRSVYNEVLNQPADFVAFIMNDYFQKNNYKMKEKNGETFFQSGNGIIAAPKFMKYNYENGVFHLEVWMKFAWLPGLYGSDMDLEGAMGFAVKKMVKSEINNLIQVLHQPLPANNNR